MFAHRYFAESYFDPKYFYPERSLRPDAGGAGGRGAGKGRKIHYYYTEEVDSSNNVEITPTEEFIEAISEGVAIESVNQYNDQYINNLVDSLKAEAKPVTVDGEGGRKTVKSIDFSHDDDEVLLLLLTSV